MTQNEFDRLCDLISSIARQQIIRHCESNLTSKFDNYIAEQTIEDARKALVTE